MERGDKVEIVHIIPAIPAGQFTALIKDTTIHDATIHEVTPEYIQVDAGGKTLVLPWAWIRQITIKSE